MSIKFVCSCGKRLKARDDMAARRTICPRCGNPVGIPSLDPNRPTPMTPAERLRAQARRPITLSHLDEASTTNQEGEALAEPEKSVSSTQYPVPSTERSTLHSKHSPPGTQNSAPRPQHSVLSTQYSVLSTQYSVPGPPGTAGVSPSSAAVPAPRPLDPTTVRLRKQRQKHRQLASRYAWALETHWYQCLGYPFRAWPLMLALVGAMTLLTTAVALVLPRLLADMPLDAISIPVGLVSALGPLTAVAYVCGFLDCVLASALAGESQHVRWPGRNLALVWRSFLAWVLAFLSAPAPLAVLGFYYWLYCGDAALVDWIILAELGIVGAGYWLLAVMAVSRSERLRDANPWRVAELAERLGWRALVAAVMAGVLFLSHGLLAFWTAGILHEKLGVGLILAAGCWLSWLYWTTVVFRVAGIWLYWREQATRA